MAHFVEQQIPFLPLLLRTVGFLFFFSYRHLGIHGHRWIGLEETIDNVL
jgi:hypothetical protein